MNLKPFLDHYKITHDAGNTPLPASLKKRVDAEFLFVLENLGGKTFNHGIYRVHEGGQLQEYTETVCEQFLACKGKAIVFAADWLGRQFILDFNELKTGKPTVSCLEPGVPDTFCTDQTIVEFHNKTLVDQADAALAEELFKKWKAKNRHGVPPGQCAGYKVPLFLGGKEDLTNLELTDMSVYVDLCCQLWNKVKDLPDGTSIGKVTISP
jgi:hypothetical protein